MISNNKGTYVLSGAQHLTLDARASYDLDGGGIASDRRRPEPVEGWYLNGNSTHSSTSPTWYSYYPIGTHSVKLKVTDHENSTDELTVTIVVKSSVAGTKYYITDHLGSVRSTVASVNGQAVVVGQEDFWFNGLTMPGRSWNNGNAYDRYKFTGHERDSEGGLDMDYMIARNYDPEIGRFMGVDPLFAKYPGLSPFMYVGGNPINAFDPDGRKIWFVHGTFSTHSTWNTVTKDNFASLLNDDYKVDEYQGWSTNKFFGNEGILSSNTHWRRVKAAEDLADDIKTALASNPDMIVNLVAHSHGGNIAIMAAEILARDGININNLIMLGTPSRTDYRLKSGNVKRLLNVSNKGDLTQIGGAIDWDGSDIGLASRQRGEGEADEVKNINIKIDGVGHSFQNSEQLINYIREALKE